MIRSRFGMANLAMRSWIHKGKRLTYSGMDRIWYDRKEASWKGGM